MPRGGARPGAGRPRGDAWKPKRPEAVRAAARVAVRKILATSRNPLDTLTEIAANPDVAVETRVAAAAAACPFLFPRLSAVATVDAGQKAGRVDPQRLIADLSARLARLAPPVPGPTIDATAEPAGAASGGPE